MFSRNSAFMLLSVIFCVSTAVCPRAEPSEPFLGVVGSDSSSIVISVEPTRIRCEISSTGEMVDDFVKQTPRAVAAINGSYYDWDQKGAYFPVGLVIDSGQMRWCAASDVAAMRDPTRQEFATKAGHERLWYATLYVAASGEAGILRSVQFDSLWHREKYNALQFALEAGPMLIENGDVVPEVFTGHVGCGLSLNRSAVGLTRDHHVLLLCSRRGMTCAEAAEILLQQGAVSAMNLDGGPSSAFAVANQPAQTIYGQKPVCTVMWVER